MPVPVSHKIEVETIRARGERNRMNTRITVQTYAGYKGDERPVSFTQDGRTCQVLKIVDRWYDQDHNCFKVLAADGKTCLLRHDLNEDEWEIVESRDTKTG